MTRPAYCPDLPGTTAVPRAPGYDGPGVPAYLRDTYTWAYLTPASLAVFDRQWVVNAILLGNYGGLERAVLEELRPGTRVLQPACVYGRFSESLAQAVGRDGSLVVADIAPIQADNSRCKLKSHPQAAVRVADAALPAAGDAPYDAICCFFLLHEVPDRDKHRIMGALLDRLAPGGKLIVVDYHRPIRLHPFRWLISLTFATLEPFARALWRQEVMDYVPRRNGYRWRKATYFGGMYQKLVIEPEPADRAG
jgi:ubiquinone/menaquinone biosynthesis C-methylase UbiE